MAAAYVAEGTPLSTLLHTLAGAQQALLPVGAPGAANPGAGSDAAQKASGPASGGGFSLGAFLSGSATQAR